MVGCGGTFWGDFDFFDFFDSVGDVEPVDEATGLLFDFLSGGLLDSLLSGFSFLSWIFFSNSLFLGLGPAS